MRQLRARTRWLVPSMVLAVAAVALLAYWDEDRESAAALEDFAQEQATLASSIANDLRHRLASTATDNAPAPAPQALLPALDLPAIGRIERPGALMLLVQPPGDGALYTTDRRVVRSPPLTQALSEGRATLRLSRPEAQALGLPERTAMAGLAGIDAGRLGHWSIAVVASAGRERDRERRAHSRLILAVGIAAGLVLAFGGFALRNQRAELQLEHDLAVTELARERDERLQRVSQAATMLTLASGMAHELGTPLGVIVGRAEQLAERMTGDERGIRSVQAILEQAERIRGVTQGFLQLARGGAPTLRDVAPGAVVQGALALVEHRFRQQGVTLQAHESEPLPVIRGEPRLLEHALVNLMLNACDACARSGIVSVDVTTHDDLVEFAVTDNGTGIDPATAARVTEPFFTTKITGTGLGLAVTNEIVKTHRGSMTIAAAAPKGTRVAFRVPVSQPLIARGATNGAV